MYVINAQISFGNYVVYQANVVYNKKFLAKVNVVGTLSESQNYISFSKMISMWFQ